MIITIKLYLLEVGQFHNSYFILIWLIGRYILSELNKPDLPIKKAPIRHNRSLSEEYISLTNYYISVLDLQDKIPIDSKMIHIATRKKVLAHQTEELEDIYNRDLAKSAREYLMDQYVYLCSPN